jgi:glycosyltransferase involved in cell wall biosynthesis
MKVTVAIISKSEKINRVTIESVQFADEIVIIVDSPPQKTKRGGKVSFFYRPLQDDFASQRNFALKNSRNNWVFFIDDDEYVGRELKREIMLLKPPENIQGFLIKRIDVCFHQPLLHGETGKMFLLRLGQKSAGKFTRSVHETWSLGGDTGKLSSPLFHIKDHFVGDFISRMNYYAPIDSQILNQEGKPYTLWRLFLYPKAKFVQNYLVRLGFLDGSAGLFLAYLLSIQSLTVRIFQWTKRN